MDLRYFFVWFQSGKPGPADLIRGDFPGIRVQAIADLQLIFLEEDFYAPGAACLRRSIRVGSLTEK
jgi:hypothetical protein